MIQVGLTYDTNYQYVTQFINMVGVYTCDTMYQCGFTSDTIYQYVVTCDTMYHFPLWSWFTCHYKNCVENAINFERAMY